MGEKNNFVRVAVVAAGAAAVAAFVTVALEPFADGEPDLFRNTETSITLRMQKNAQDQMVCVLVSKNTGPRAKKDGRIRWKVKNRCESEQTVTIGNFRNTEATETVNCDLPTGSNTAWFFEENKDDPAKRRTSPAKNNTRNIDLNINLPNITSTVTYFFDVCLGATKSDPRLIIDP
jgi:hypothetical protein